MRVDLTGKFLSADRHVRIVTNLCVYWDQIFFTTHEAPAPSATPVPLARRGPALPRLLDTCERSGTREAGRV